MNIFRESFAASGMALRHEARRLTRDPRILTRIESLARQLDRPLPQVTRDAESRLNEMVTVQSATHRYLWDKALGPAHTRAFTVDADQAALSRLKKLNKQYPLVILPSHRSYADPFIMAKTIVEHGLKRTHILGGDNLKFFPFAPIVRGSGGVFIRRRFGDDEIYKAMVQEYLSHLLAEGENIEWYMEGGRSRTGKLRPPKYGLLNYLVQAIKNGAARDVMLVPTSITYDQLHEVRAMAQQEISGFKPKEGLSWLLEYVRGQQKWIGEVHIRFGETISLAQRIRAAGEDTELNRYLVEKTAFEVFRQINAATPVTAQALLTLALLAADRALTLNALYQQLQHFLEYARARSLPTSQLEPLRHHHGVMDTLETLVGTQVVDRFEKGTEPVFSIKPGQHSVAAFYRNSAIHWFINRAVLELAMFKAAYSGESDLVKAGKRETLALRDLLKFEFIFSDRAGFRTELLQESDLFDPDWRQQIATAEQRLKMIEAAPFLVAHTVLPTFLEAYFVLADRLAAKPAGHRIDRDQLLDECMSVGQQYVLQRRLRHPECLSRELFANALRLADNRNLLKPGGPELIQARADLARECQQHVEAVNNLEALATRRNDQAAVTHAADHTVTEANHVAA